VSSWLITNCASCAPGVEELSGFATELTGGMHKGNLRTWFTSTTEEVKGMEKLIQDYDVAYAAAFWGQKISTHFGKNLIVVDKDIDVFDDDAVEWAMAYRTNAAMGDIQFFSGTIGSSLDPSVPVSQRDVMKYGQGKWTRVLIDATVSWELEPQEQWGGRREPPLCTEITPETEELVNRRWDEYGIPPLREKKAARGFAD